MRPGNLSRAARRELLAALQASRAAPRGKKDDAASVTQQVIKEKLGGALFSDHHQMQLLAQQAQLKHGAERVTQTTVADYARKTYLYGVRNRLVTRKFERLRLEVFFGLAVVFFELEQVGVARGRWQAFGRCLRSSELVEVNPVLSNVRERFCYWTLHTSAKVYL